METSLRAAEKVLGKHSAKFLAGSGHRTLCKCLLEPRRDSGPEGALNVVGFDLDFLEEKQTSLVKSYILNTPVFTNVKLFPIFIMLSFPPSGACGR